MNHLFRVILVLSLAAVAVAVLIVSNNRANPRPSYQVAVEEYVAYRRSTTIPTLTITTSRAGPYAAEFPARDEQDCRSAMRLTMQPTGVTIKAMIT